MQPSTSGLKHSVWERMSRLWLHRDTNSPVERKALALDASRVKLCAMKQVRRCCKRVLLHFRKQRGMPHFTEDNLQRIIINPYYAITVAPQLTKEHEPATSGGLGNCWTCWRARLALQSSRSIRPGPSTSTRFSPPSIP